MATARKSVRKKLVDDGIAVVRSEDNVDISTLNGYFKNPRVGDIDAMVESLKENGQYRRALINVGTHTGREREILAGNHMILAMRKLGLKTVNIDWCDVSEIRARKIVLADNRVAQLGTMDDTVLKELLSDLPSLEGSGYTDLDFEDLATGLEKSFNTDLADFENKQKQEAAAEEALKRSKTFEGAPLGEEPEPGSEDGADDESGSYVPKRPDIQDASEEAAGIQQIKPAAEVDFGDGLTYWQIPNLLPKMLMTWDELEAIEKLDSWAGSATKDVSDPDQWWLYNYGVDSTSGMQQPYGQCIISFYTFDEYFELWWMYPERYIQKLLNSDVQYALTPDWSQGTYMKKTECLWQLYRARYIGRFMQECGLKIIPNITWIDGDVDWLSKYVLATLPKKLPMIAIQMQTINENEVTGGLDHYRDQLNLIFSTLQPEGALIYAGPQGRKMLEALNTGKTKLRVIGTRQEKLSAHMKDRKKAKAGL